MKKPREHPAPNTPQKWLHLSEEAANSFRNDWKEHFILLGFQQWEHDSRWEDLITYVCCLFRYLERIGDYLTKQNCLKECFFHPSKSLTFSFIPHVSRLQTGCILWGSTALEQSLVNAPPQKKIKGQEDWCMCVCFCMCNTYIYKYLHSNQYIHNIFMYIYHTSILLNTLNMEMYHSQERDL